ncbi:hypothetical protein ACFQ3B_19040 [Stackebrandtia endophytica]|nr:hypothetical protein [Stackebrandtia endophytica]
MRSTLGIVLGGALGVSLGACGVSGSVDCEAVSMEMAGLSDNLGQDGAAGEEFERDLAAFRETGKAAGDTDLEHAIADYADVAAELHVELIAAVERSDTEVGPGFDPTEIVGLADNVEKACREI